MSYKSYLVDFNFYFINNKVYFINSKVYSINQRPQIRRQLVSKKPMHSEEIPYIAKEENIQCLIFYTIRTKFGSSYERRYCHLRSLTKGGYIKINLIFSIVAVCHEVNTQFCWISCHGMIICQNVQRKLCNTFIL